MAMESSRSHSINLGRRHSELVSDENQHLHGVEINAL